MAEPWRYRYSAHPTSPDGGLAIRLDGGSIQDFGADRLGLGAPNLSAEPQDSLAAMLDLEGFTAFCRQVDFQLTAPLFVDDFLSWLFRAIREELCEDASPEPLLYAHLPYFTKFLGDGILLLWEVPGRALRQAGVSRSAREHHQDIQWYLCNVVVVMLRVCRRYCTEFLEGPGARYTAVPSRLRCGIARGSVVPVGNGSDYIGPCINIAARLQKFNGLGFAFSARGVSAELGLHVNHRKRFTLKVAEIRGIGAEERVYVLASEFQRLAPRDQAMFAEPMAPRCEVFDLDTPAL